MYPEKTIIARDDDEVAERLHQLGLSKSELIEMVMEAVSAKNESVAIDPINAPGILAYIFGTRAIRERLLLKGWEVDRTDNIESTYNPNSNIKLIYQNADSAADPLREPKAISGKGTATSRVVENGQTGYLFEEMQQDYENQIARANSLVWFLCVAITEDTVTAELSCPRSIDGNQFNGFNERIFVIKHGEWDNPSVVESLSYEYPEIQDYEINISRKE